MCTPYSDYMRAKEQATAQGLHCLFYEALFQAGLSPIVSLEVQALRCAIRMPFRGEANQTVSLDNDGGVVMKLAPRSILCNVECKRHGSTSQQAAINLIAQVLGEKIGILQGRWSIAQADDDQHPSIYRVTTVTMRGRHASINLVEFPDDWLLNFESRGVAGPLVMHRTPEFRVDQQEECHSFLTLLYRLSELFKQEVLFEGRQF